MRSADSLPAGRESAEPSSSPALTTPTSRVVIGVALPDSGRVWCAMLPPDAGVVAAAGVDDPELPVSIVPGRTDGPPSMRGTLARAQRVAPCETGFPQPRWEGYTAHRVVLLEMPAERELGTLGMPPSAMLVPHPGSWTRTPEGRVRLDLDGDGQPEEARRCAAGEGEHFTVWRATPGGGWTRVAHEYFDWGAFVEPTCGPGEIPGEG